jgi:subtilase family serine protease
VANIPSGYRHLERSERRAAPGSGRIRSADPKEMLSVTIRVRRRPDAPPLPDPSSFANSPAGQKSFLSREEFAARYGASQADLDAVAHFARSHGLTVMESSVARRTVIVSGSVAQMNRAFAIELGHYKSPTETYRGREGYVHLPNDLADIVEGVFGLDNRQMARPLLRRGSPATGAPTTPTPTQVITQETPPQVAKLYNFPAPMNLAGQTIGLLEFGGGYTLADVEQYFTGPGSPLGPGFTTPTVVAVPTHGATNAPDDSDSSVEVALDIAVAGSVAPGAKIAVYFAPWTEQGWINAVTMAVHDATNKPSVLSISWGWPEFQEIEGLLWSAAAMDAVSMTFQEAGALGVTIFAASGDNGSSCGISSTPPAARVLYPASDPWLTACGGTTIENVAGSSFAEATWNDNGATGGGISDHFDPQTWQSSANIPPSINAPGTRRGRGVPDVAANADPDSGYMLIVNGSAVGPIGGTSAAAPLYAALVALMNATLGHSVGYLNMTLYSLGGTSVFRDITDGGSNATGGAPGYSSGPGWDACTGLGSLDGIVFMSALHGRSIQATITRTDPGADLPGTHLPVTLDFEISGTSFTPGGEVGGLAEPVIADQAGSFSWNARIRPNAQFPGFDPSVGQQFSVKDVAVGETVSAVIAEIEG